MDQGGCRCNSCDESPEARKLETVRRQWGRLRCLAEHWTSGSQRSLKNRSVKREDSDKPVGKVLCIVVGIVPMGFPKLSIRLTLNNRNELGSPRNHRHEGVLHTCSLLTTAPRLHPPVRPTILAMKASASIGCPISMILRINRARGKAVSFLAVISVSA